MLFRSGSKTPGKGITIFEYDEKEGKLQKVFCVFGVVYSVVVVPIYKLLLLVLLLLLLSSLLFVGVVVGGGVVLRLGDWYCCCFGCC